MQYQPYHKKLRFFLGFLSIQMILSSCNVAVDQNRRTTVDMTDLDSDESKSTDAIKSENLPDESVDEAGMEANQRNVSISSSFPSKNVDPNSEQNAIVDSFDPKNIAKVEIFEMDAILGVRKLSHHEYSEAMLALVGYDVDPNSIPKDNRALGVLELASKNPITKFSTNDYFEVAKSASSEKASQVAGEVLNICDENDMSCVGNQLERFIEKAFGRTPTQEEIQNYLSLFENPGIDFQDKVEGFLLSLLISPNFVYQIENKSPNEDRLLAGAIGKRMSLLILNALPDDMVLEKVRDNSILDPDVRLELATQMLQDPRAKTTFVEMVRNWLEISDQAIVEKSDRVIATFSPQEIDALKASFVTEVEKSFDAPDLFGSLFSNSQFESNEGINRVFSESKPSLDNTGNNLQLPKAPHSSILTHPFVIASHSFQSGYFPYKFSVFLLGSVLCQAIPAPPKNIAELIQKEQMNLGPSDQNLTFRQSQERLTSGPSCAACHAIVGPPGFAFLPFDPIGRYIQADSNSIPFDTKGSITLDGKAMAFEDSGELSDLFAQSNQIRKCFNKIIGRSYLGRAVPRNFVEQIGLISGPVSYEELIKKHVSSALFIKQ